MSSPWADPSTPTEPGAPYAGSPYAGPPYAGPPYAGPPPTGAYPGYPPAWQQPPWPPGGYGWPPYGYPAPWGGAPPGPRRPGQVVAAAVLAFVQAALVLLATAYVFMLAMVAGVAADESLALPGGLTGLATEAKVVAVVQLLSGVGLIVAGLLALGRRRQRTWPVLVAAFGLQLVLAAYWGIRLGTVLRDLPGAQASGPVVSLALFFAAQPAVALGLVLVGPGRRWFAEREPGAA